MTIQIGKSYLNTIRQNLQVRRQIVELSEHSQVRPTGKKANNIIRCDLCMTFDLTF